MAVVSNLGAPGTWRTACPTGAGHGLALSGGSRSAASSERDRVRRQRNAVRHGAAGAAVPRPAPARARAAGAACVAAGRACSAGAGQMLLVAVHPWDIHGAHQAGMRTGWIARQQTPYPGYFAAPDLHAPDLVTLAGQIVS